MLDSKIKPNHPVRDTRTGKVMTFKTYEEARKIFTWPEAMGLAVWNLKKVLLNDRVVRLSTLAGRTGVGAVSRASKLCDELDAGREHSVATYEDIERVVDSLNPPVAGWGVPDRSCRRVKIRLPKRR